MVNHLWVCLKLFLSPQQAQGKSSGCQQGVSVTSGTTSGCLGQEVPAEQPWQLEVLSFLLEIT